MAERRFHRGVCYRIAPAGRDRTCTEEEIQQLLEGALQLGGLRGWTYYSLFGLLCVTGLRLSEALNLRSEDIDLAEGVLTIQTGKFGKSRLVPIHASTQKVLQDYLQR